MIYLDHNATTPVDPRVLAEMLPFFSQEFGNAASLSHGYGHAALRAIRTARQRVATLIGAQPAEIIWTSGATEANNLALLGVVRPLLERRPNASPQPPPCHIITQATEHPSVYEACQELRRLGAQLTILPVDAAGRISPEQVREALRPHTVLVSIMAGNHEIGTLQPIREIGDICRAAGVLFHTDASQAAGKIPLHVGADHIDLLSLSAHKFSGPKGAGALFIRAKSPRIELLPLMFGGAHERGLRPGTLNVPAIVGMGKAAQLAAENLTENAPRMATLRDRLESALKTQIPSIHINAAAAPRLPNVSSITFPNVEGEALMMALDDVAVSSGSACASMSRRPSRVLLAIGLDEQTIFSTLRLSLGPSNTPDEIDRAAHAIAAVVHRLRQLHPASAPTPQSSTIPPRSSQ